MAALKNEKVEKQQDSATREKKPATTVAKPASAITPAPIQSTTGDASTAVKAATIPNPPTLKAQSDAAFQPLNPFPIARPAPQAVNLASPPAVASRDASVSTRSQTPAYSGDTRRTSPNANARNTSPHTAIRQLTDTRGRSPPKAATAQILAWQNFQSTEREMKTRYGSASPTPAAYSSTVNAPVVGRRQSPEAAKPTQRYTHVRDSRTPSPAQKSAFVQDARKTSPGQSFSFVQDARKTSPAENFTFVQDARKTSPPPQSTPIKSARSTRPAQRSTPTQAARTTPPAQRFAPTRAQAASPTPSRKTNSRSPPSRERQPRAPATAAVAGWQNFFADNAVKEREDAIKAQIEHEEWKAERIRQGLPTQQQYTIHETHKIRPADGKGKMEIIKTSRTNSPESESAEAKAKRERSMSPQDSNKAQKTGHVKNEDEIDVQMTDSSSNASCSVSPPTGDQKRAGSILSDDSIDGGVKIRPDSPAAIKVERNSPGLDGTTEEIRSPIKSIRVEASADIKHDKPVAVMSMNKVVNEDVTPEMRAQLAALSSTFDPAATVAKAEKKEFVPLPTPQIHNKISFFLSLDKVDLNRDFLQLMEVDCLSAPRTKTPQGPHRLSYDKEWLAILRTFADELHLGGNATDPVPEAKSPEEYRARILKEEQWIERNVVQAGKMMIPNNFVITAPVHDPSRIVGEDAMPREYTNPQTSTFCKLIGIENKFDLSEEERAKRMKQGPSAYVKKEKVRGGRRGAGGRGRAGAAGEQTGGGHGMGGRGGRKPGRKQGEGGGW